MNVTIREITEGIFISQVQSMLAAWGRCRQGEPGSSQRDSCQKSALGCGFA
jgi:hypothetical protein